MNVYHSMNYDEAVGFYHSLNRFGIRPGLDSIKKLLARLGNPQDGLVCVHVAGTNGKGSVCTFLSEIFKADGYKTGLYMSPYITEFGERIQINNEIIPPDRLCDITEKVKREVIALAETGVEITEFEAVTAAGFLYFAEEKCDRVVLETGLGGRLDATNIIKNPIVSVIVSISIDHTKILGETIEKIAYEKCGIIKENCPVVTNSLQNEAALSVIEKTACERNSRLQLANTADAIITKSDIFGTEFSYLYEKFYVPFPGVHQVENAVTAIKAAEVAGASLEAMKTGIANAKNPARTEIISREPLIILDGSHNDGSTRALAKVLNDNLANKKILGVMGMMADKEVDKAVSNLSPYFDTVVALTPTNPRAMPSNELVKILERHNIKAIDGGEAVDGINIALDLLDNFDACVVCGSLYLASDVRNILRSKK